jgi:large repetitive protein
VALTDPLSSPFTLSGSTANVSYGAGASGPASPVPASGTNTVAFGTAGNPANSFTLNPGSSLTLTFNITLNSAAAGTYQNPVNLRFADPTRSTGGAALAAVNPTATPGATYANGQPVGGSNYNAASSTQEDIVISGAPGTNADLAITKSGPATVEVGQPVAYTLLVSNNGSANVSGSITVSDIVPANIGTVTWVCTSVAGAADCDTATAGVGSAGSGNNVSLTRVALTSGGQIQIAISGTAITAGTVVNTATVALPSGFADPTPSNNLATATTSITTPSADLSISKTNNMSTVTSGGVTAYTIIVGNAGPSNANNAVVADPAAVGLLKLSVSCSAQGGAACPPSLSTSTFQSGIAIATFPAGSTLIFTLNAQVTASSGNVTNVATITPPSGTIDSTPGNNSATDADAVVVSPVRVISAASICPAGSTEQIVNLLSNSNFADTSLSVGANVIQGASDVYPPDTRVALQSGAKNYVGGVVIQNPFPGDVARSVAATSNWLYSNGNTTGAAYRIWSQPVSGLTPGRTYQWLYYGSNALASGNTSATDLPQIEFRVLTGTSTATLGTVDSYANEAAGTTDTWTLRQRTFVPSASAVTLQLWDTVVGATGDDFASTQIQLRECRPSADVFVTKSNGVSQVRALGTTVYVITVGNNGPGDADNINVIDPAASGLNKTAVTCQASGIGAACPPLVNVSGFEGAGLLIPTLPAGTTVIFTVNASVTALNGSVTNAVSLTLPAGLTDGTLTNNSASDTDNVLGAAAISITKTNNTTTLVAGSTTSYTITVNNAGPSNASGAVLRDPPTPGLACTGPAVCTASGGASCGAPSVPLATLQSGFTIPSFPSGGQLVLTLNCGVTATGQ